MSRTLLASVKMGSSPVETSYSYRHSGQWKPCLTDSASTPMAMSTWRCLLRTCLPAVVSSVGTGNYWAPLPGDP